MLLNADHIVLQAHEQKLALQSTYLLVGKNLFAGIECAQALSDYAKSQGFTEREVFYLSAKFDFRQLFDCLQSQSLFSGKKIVEVRFDSEKCSKKEIDALALAASKVGHNVLLVQATNVNAKTQKDKAFLALHKVFNVIDCPAVYPNQFDKWLVNRLKRESLNLQSEAFAAVSLASQGNLFWAQQIIWQLALLASSEPAAQTISSEQVKTLLSDQSVFQISDLLDAILQRSDSALHVLQKLRAENTPVILINALLSKDIELLIQLHQAHDKTAVFEQFKVWPNRRTHYQRCYSQFHPRTLEKSLLALAVLDKASKGVSIADEWSVLEQIVFILLSPAAHHEVA